MNGLDFDEEIIKTVHVDDDGLTEHIMIHEHDGGNLH